jgi:hypothetical protein
MRYQVEQVVEDFELDTCIVTDARGHVLAAPLGCRRALSASLARGAADEREGPGRAHLLAALRSHLPARSIDDLQVQEFRVDGELHRVITLGASPSMAELGGYRTIFGVRRIHRELCC